MEDNYIRVKEDVLIDYVIDNLSILKVQILKEYQYSYKVKFCDSLTVGILFEKSRCKIFYCDIENGELINVFIKTYNEFISDAIINKFKELNLPVYMQRFQKFNNEMVRELIIDLLLLGKFELKFNPFFNEVECYWKKGNISFLISPESNELYNVL
ncbi:hypothetical protein [Bacillus sp. Cr_A10]|uniref:hypothetical protein n=1 Tax=Bacillus sp. Cr_A10 TaxID=3033993 RepID=UPI0023D9F502|nr:hypothetical protein [Bacillus sp. Cr_A10]MDF2065103.1 hypothetical protein [Bacillus sp. Cr_A10]